MKKMIFVLACLAFVVSWAARPALAEEPMDEQITVDKAQVALKEFMGDPDMVWMQGALKKAEGILIIPTLYKGGFFLGGSGGNGVFFARDHKTGRWNGPAFYNLGSVTFGLQIGGEAAQVIILAMNESAVKALLSPSVRLGADIGIAAGPVGAGASGSSTFVAQPFLSFARAKGAYAGLILEGAVLNTDTGGNKAYYFSQKVKVEDILLTGEAYTDRARGLREAVAEAGKR